MMKNENEDVHVRRFEMMELFMIVFKKLNFKNFKNSKKEKLLKNYNQIFASTNL